MKPIRLTARGYRSFADLDYVFVDGATAVTGSNGAGKSTLIGAVEIALFGPRSRSLEPLVREGENELQLCLEFQHGADQYRVRRGWKSGRSTLDLERLGPGWHAEPDEHGDPVQVLSHPEWEPLTQGSAADTQALLEQTIGLSRSTFLASGYLAQRQSDSFTGAQPKDRKRILSDALALDQWQVDADKVGADRRVLERDVTAVEARLPAIADKAAQAEPLGIEHAAREMEIEAETVAANEARGTAETEAARAAELDQAETAWKVASANAAAARSENSAHLERAAAAQVARERLDGARTDLARLGTLEAERVAATARRDALAAQLAARTKVLAERDGYLNRAADLMGQAEQLIRPEIDGLENVREIGRRIQALATDKPCCDRCGQTVEGEAHTRATASLAAEAEQATAAVAAITQKRADLRAEALRLDDEQRTIVIPDEPEGLAELISRVADLASVPTDLATVRERVAGFEQTISQIDTDEYRDTARRLSYEQGQAEQALAAIVQPEPGAADHARAAALQAKAQAEAHASRARTARERLAAVSALLEQAQAAATEHEAAIVERDRLHAELDILVRLEQAFGRDGIPAWIVESQALPHIESEANRILSRLGGAISRVELRTERETKSGALRDALDIVCLTDDGERALETFSGGEQSRAEIALALGLVDVLANRRGADLRYLALDEPSGLDSQGTEALAEILRERAGSVVLLASHDPGLRDQFDQSVLVQRGPRGSEVIA